eukprot:TRINITY_DN25080_c0_g1_i1.p1 TRINITY_DN25080_c0_g1~~TRINITY_DN25080_c0_g1_i1.p1  ORF type:complete len:150 (-),score=30.96 TRINITY_DN25080_c0_g1_i1:9-458(-)
MTYAAVRFTEESGKKIERLCGLLGIKNGVPREKLHCTTLYSPALVPGHAPLGRIEPGWLTDPGDEPVVKENNNTIILLFNCAQLEEHRRDVARRFQLRPPSFPLHVTLSYQAGDFEMRIKVLDLFPDFLPLEICLEYAEPFDQEWDKKI